MASYEDGGTPSDRQIPVGGHAFISYVRDDSAEVDELQHTLEAAGIPVWRDTESLWPGQDWRAMIRNAITQDALVFIACFSSRSAARRQSYMNEELLLAIDQLRLRRPHDPWLVPVRFDDCDVPDLELGAGRTLRSIQRADLFGASRDLAARRLVTAVQRLLQQAAPPAPGRPSAEEPEPRSDARPRQPAAKPAAARNPHQPITGNFVHSVLDNAAAPWNTFSSNDYWRRNYRDLHPEDQKIIEQVSDFFIRAFTGRPRARQGIDVGSGTNLYPALLMLPWTERILLADYSESNVSWLRDQITDDTGPWPWLPFWREMQEANAYRDVNQPRKQLHEACQSEPGYSGVERLSIFDLPEARWDLGTMFFVAESITEIPNEFRAAVARFVGALKPGAPFAAAFMAGSAGYEVAGTAFPAVPITPDDVRLHLAELGIGEPTVELVGESRRVRDGFEGMIVATGFASNRRLGRGS